MNYRNLFGKRGMIFLFLSVVILLLAAMPALAQFSPWRVDTSFSTEWEATAFNGGRRMVRDSEGYLHAVYHSRPTSGTAPTGTGCSIFYAYTQVPCNGNNFPAQPDWIIQEIVPVLENPYDNRYPALVIEHGTKDDPRGNDVLHLVWQRDTVYSDPPGTGDYEIWYMSTFGNDIDIPGGLPAVWNPPVQIWDNNGHHDLVPSIACNYNNHLHLAWQSEAYEGGPSQILYARSIDNGITWTDDQGNVLITFGGGASPFNLSATPCSSQCPSIACVIDAPTTPTITPGSMEYTPGSVEPYTYTTETVHIAWHDKMDGESGTCLTGIGDYHIFYSYSPNDGKNWTVFEDVSDLTAGDRDIYVSLTVDYYDQPHISFMHGCDNEHDPEPPGPANYLAGVSPVNPVSFPGPDPGMYGALNQMIVYTFRAWTPPLPMGVWQPRTFITSGTTDDEFPTIAMDKDMGLHLSWQSWGSAFTEYVIMMNFNAFNWAMPGFVSWTIWDVMGWELTFDGLYDDLFPSEAHKKVAMYSGNTPGDLDLVWTRISGLGSTAAISGTQEVWYLGSTVWTYPPAYPMAPLNPQVEGKTNPTDVSTPSPNMTWTFNDNDLPVPGDNQTAYQVLLASSAANLSNDIGDIWDTGKVTSGMSTHVLSPPPPGGGATYYWKVKTWDSVDLPGTFCPQQTFKYATGVPVELSIFNIE